MNLSQLITRIKISCGIYALSLPLEDPDLAITETIKNITLRTFSTYCPAIETLRFDLWDLERLEKKANHETYLLPDLFTEREILYIRDIRYDEATMRGIGYWGGDIPILNGGIFGEAMLSNASMRAANMIIPKLTFHYEHPRKVTLFNVLSSQKLVFELALLHDKSLASITPTMEESFFSLAVLDVKSMLYETLKHYNEMQTAYGTINLKIDDWAQAADARKTLLDEWEAVYQMDILPYTTG